MRDTIILRCSNCGQVHSYTVKFIEGLLKGMRMNKAKEASMQMYLKRGPFYDRWKAAMEDRGEQYRCSDCDRLAQKGLYTDDPFCVYHWRKMNSGRFACKWFKPIEGE